MVMLPTPVTLLSGGAESASCSVLLPGVLLLVSRRCSCTSIAPTGFFVKSRSTPWCSSLAANCHGAAAATAAADGGDAPCCELLAPVCSRVGLSHCPCPRGVAPWCRSFVAVGPGAAAAAGNEPLLCDSTNAVLCPGAAAATAAAAAAAAAVPTSLCRSGADTCSRVDIPACRSSFVAAFVPAATPRPDLGDISLCCSWASGASNGPAALWFALLLGSCSFASAAPCPSCPCCLVRLLGSCWSFTPAVSDGAAAPCRPLGCWVRSAADAVLDLRGGATAGLSGLGGRSCTGLGAPCETIFGTTGLFIGGAAATVASLRGV